MQRKRKHCLINVPPSTHSRDAAAVFVSPRQRGSGGQNASPGVDHPPLSSPWSYACNHQRKVLRAQSSAAVHGVSAAPRMGIGDSSSCDEFDLIRTRIPNRNRSYLNPFSASAQHPSSYTNSCSSYHSYSYFDGSQYSSLNVYSSSKSIFYRFPTLNPYSHSSLKTYSQSNSFFVHESYTVCFPLIYRFAVSR